MTWDKVRAAISATIIAGALLALIVHPVSLSVLLSFAALGIVAGVLSSLPGTVVGWISGAILVFGTPWLQSILAARGAELTWYAPMLIAVSFAVMAYYGANLFRRKTPAKAGV